MSITPLQWDETLNVLERVLRFDAPADRVLSRHFREHPALGARDRAFIAESVFGVLRHGLLLEKLTEQFTPRALLLAYLTRIAGLSVRSLAPFVRGDEQAWLSALRAADTSAFPLAVRAELPVWVVERLATRLSHAGILQLGRALAQPAPLDLRVNTLKATREAVLARFAAEGIAAEPTPYSPVGIRLADKPAINRHPLFLEGVVEVQDEGSQILGYLLAPGRHAMVADFCAGAGGKTLLLGALMHSQGRLYAFDVSAKRLARFKPRLARSGLSNVHPQLIAHERDKRLARLSGKFDRVLVDAPCSGLGTLRRNPDLKWRQAPTAVGELAAKQRDILAAAARLVKAGGRLLYATCSILPEENEDVVSDFLAEHPDFRAEHCGEALAASPVPLAAGQFLHLSPDVHGTDAFFAALFTRNPRNP
jgi:16S rRNA (cytosine967-C5)-methyltransferase